MSFIRINATQASSLRKKYGNYHALDPIPLPDSSDYILTDDVLAEPAFAEVLDTLETLPAYSQWETGTAYAVGIMVEHDDRLWRCVQAHTSQSDWQPPVVPALWVTAHEPGTIPDWVQPQGSHDVYPLGARVMHNGKMWESAVDNNVWQPGAPGTEALWRLVSDGGDDGGEEPTAPDAWQPGVTYAAGDEVTYDGATYRCVQAHTSQVGWHPTAVPALWQLV